MRKLTMKKWDVTYQEYDDTTTSESRTLSHVDAYDAGRAVEEVRKHMTPGKLLQIVKVREVDPPEGWQSWLIPYPPLLRSSEERVCPKCDREVVKLKATCSQCGHHTEKWACPKCKRPGISRENLRIIELADGKLTTAEIAAKISKEFGGRPRTSDYVTSRLYYYRENGYPKARQKMHPMASKKDSEDWFVSYANGETFNQIAKRYGKSTTRVNHKVKQMDRHYSRRLGILLRGTGIIYSQCYASRTHGGVLVEFEGQETNYQWKVLSPKVVMSLDKKAIVAALRKAPLVER